MIDGLIRLDTQRRIGALDRLLFGNFIEHLGRCIYGGIYQPGSPFADENGFRKDVLQAAKRLQVPILRWPGGNFVSGYHWTDGIGPIEDRPKRPELAWKSVEPNTFGTDDFIKYCRALGAEPYICVNMGTGTQDEAMAWVEYCNGTLDTHYANLRRKYGNPDPYGVKYWGLGNEIYGPWQIGHKNAEDYAKAALEFAKVMKWIDPTIELVACGAQHVDWDWEVLRKVGKLSSYISAHFYWLPEKDSDPHYTIAAGPYHAEEYLVTLAGLIKAARREQKIDHEIKIAVDEWNVWYRARDTTLEEKYDLTDALAVAAFLNILRRNCKTIGMANLAQMVNVIAPIFTSDDGLFLQTIYWPLVSAVELGGPIVLDASVESDSFPAQKLLDKRVPYIDACATLDEERGRLYVSLVNFHKDEGAKLQIKLDRKVASLKEHLITGPRPQATNSFEEPDLVRLVSRDLSPLGDGSVIYEIPAHSASTLELILG